MPRTASQTDPPSTPAAQSLIKTIRTLLGLLTPGERRRMGWVLIASLMTAGLETAGVASILPFMALVVDPGVLTRYPVVANVAQFLGANTWREAVVWAAVGTGAMVALGNAARIGGNWLQWRFEADVRHRLTVDLQRAYLYAPYTFHLKRDAPSLLKVINHDVRSVTTNLLIPILAGTSRAFLVLALLGLLAVQSPVVAAGAFLTLGGAYALVFRLTKHRQSQLGQQANTAEYEWRLTGQEGLAGIKELTVLERRDTTAARFADADRTLAEISVSRRVTETVPRHVLETITLICHVICPSVG